MITGKTKIKPNNIFGGLFSGDFFKKKSIVSKEDIQALENYNKLLEDNEPAEAFKQAMSGASVTAQKLANSANGAAVNISAIPKASRAAAVGMKALAVVGNATLSMLAASVVSGVIGWISDLVNASEKAKKDAEELTAKLNSRKEVVEGNISTIEGLEEEFKRLSKGVDDYGANISLTTDEYKRYQDIVQEILGISPGLIAGFDKEGNAIANKNSLIEQSIELLKEENRQRIQNATSEKTVKTLAKGKIEEYKDAKKSYYDKGGVRDLELDIAERVADAVYYDRISETNIVNMMNEIGGDILATFNETTGTFDERVETAIARNAEQLTQNYGKYRSILEKYLVSKDLTFIDDTMKAYSNKYSLYIAKIESAAKALNPTLQTVPQSLTVYDELSNKQKAFIAEYVNTFRITASTTEEDVENMRQNILEFTQAIGDATPETKQAIEDLFSLDITKMPAAEWEKQVNELISQIVDSLTFDSKEDKNNFVKNLKIRLGIEFTTDGETSVSTMLETVKGEVQDEFDAEVDKLDFVELKIAYDIISELPEGASLSWDELQEKIREAKEASGEMTVSLSDLKSAADGLEILGKAFKELSDNGYISLDTLSKIKSTFAGSVDDIDSYIDRLMEAKVGSKEFTSALTDLTYGYINQKMNTEQLANADETYIATLLKEVGVSNSVQVAQHMIAVAKEKLRLETEGVSLATVDEINELMNETGATNATKQAIIELAREKVELNAKKIDSSDDIEQLMAVAKAAGIAAESYAVLARLKESGVADMTPEQLANTRLTPNQTRALEEYNKLKNGEFEFNWENTDLYSYTPKVQYTGGSSKSSSDKNKPDYEDPTDAIINRINLRSNELEQQEEYIQNALEITEIEKDYEKQISSTNDLIDKRKERVKELKTANADLHQMAEDLRNSTPAWNEEEWFDSQGNATEAYYTLYNDSSKEDQEKIKDQFEKISKIKEAWVKNDEELVSLNKELLQDAETLNDLYSTLHENKVGDIEHARDMALANDENADVTPFYKQLQDEYHKEAERLRALDPVKYKEEIQKLQLAWWDAQDAIVDARKEKMEKSIKDIEDYIDARNTYNDWGAYGDSEVKAIQRQTKIIGEEYKQRLITRDEYIDKLEEQSKKIYSLAQSEIDKNLSNIDKYISARNHYNDWDEFGDSEIKAIKRQIQYLDAAYKQKLISYEDYTERVAEYTQKMYSVAKDDITEEVSRLIEDYEEMKNLESSKLESGKTLLQSYYDVTNAVAEAQHEINKELKASMTMYEYLDEDTRKLLFNQEDYNALSEELLEIQEAADALQKQYQEDILNANAETIDEITEQYQMQYETMMKQYEIAKAELEVAKKRQQLDNVLAERNTRMFINGQWQWVAKTQDVINAQNELADAEINRKKQEASLEQTEDINDFTKQINSLETDLKQVRKFWDDMQELLNGESDEVAKALKQISEVSSPELRRVIDATGGNITSFSGMLSESTEAMSNIIDGDRSFGTMADSISTIITDLRNYSTAIQALTLKIGGTTSGSSGGRVVQVGSDGNAPSGTKIGDTVKTAGGDYLVVPYGTEGSTYNPASGLSSIKIKERNADGTRYTAGGMTLMGEEGFEAYITNSGRLIPIDRPTIGNIGAGGIVFNREQMAGLRTLWDWSNLIKTTPSVSSSNSNSQSTVIDNSIHISGLTVGEEGNEDWINGLRRYVATHK